MTWYHWIWGIIEARDERSHVISKTYWSTDFFHSFFNGGMRPHKVRLASRWHSAEGLNRAEALPCATSTDAFLYVRAHVNTHIRTRACMSICASLFQTCTHTHIVYPSICSFLSQHTAGARGSVTELGWVGWDGIIRSLWNSISIVSKASSLLELIWKI